MEKLMRFFKDEEGVTAIEYGLIATLIAVVIIIAVGLIGTSLSGTFQNIGSHVPATQLKDNANYDLNDTLGSVVAAAAVVAATLAQSLKLSDGYTIVSGMSFFH